MPAMCARVCAHFRWCSVGVACAVFVCVGLGLIGPYSLLSGAFAIDIGGKTDSGLVCGLSDAVGYAVSACSFRSSFL